MTKAYVPAEWAKQEAVMVGFPSHQSLWEGSLLQEARQEVANLCNALSEVQPCYVVVANAETQALAQKMLSSRATIIRLDFGDIWLRDIAPIFKSPKQALRFVHNGWGGKYLYPFDDSFAERVADALEVDTQFHDFILEGGALEHNGVGAILTTKQCLLHVNRNRWQQGEAQEHLLQAFNAERVYWLNEGLAFDHTDGHIDNAARFVNTDTVLCHRSQGVDDPNAKLYLEHSVELCDQGLKLETVVSPGLIKDASGEVMPASHLNFVLANDLLIFPNYLKYRFANKACVDEAKEKLAHLYPSREVLSFPSNAILTGGGSFHCISQHIPAG